MSNNQASHSASNSISNPIINKRIISYKKLIKPVDLLHTQPITSEIKTLVQTTRNEISDILNKHDNRLIFIVGPCSIHNIEEAKQYARKLKQISDNVNNKILIIMRVYFEKPRTTIGWKGLINDPNLDESYDVNKGLRLARELLLYINSIGLPCGYEVLDTITPQYICDLISWSAVGARTTESQVHRQLVSGLSMPVGFKNGTDGTIKMAADAITSAAYPHCFMGITDTGEPAIYKTRGNEDCHIILRGGATGPNYYDECVKKTAKILITNNLKPNIMIDCSHGNSQQNHENQPLVLNDVIQQIVNAYNNITVPTIIGVMIESNLNSGKQILNPETPQSLKPGISITDGCVDIETTNQIITDAYNNLGMNILTISM